VVILGATSRYFYCLKAFLVLKRRHPPHSHLRFFYIAGDGEGAEGRSRPAGTAGQARDSGGRWADDDRDMAQDRGGKPRHDVEYLNSSMNGYEHYS